VKGVSGTALEFDGANDSVRFSNKRGLRQVGPKEFTIELWIYLNKAGSYQVISSWGSRGVGVSFNLQIVSGEIRVMTINDAAPNMDDYYKANLFPGQWYHVVVVRKPDTEACYLNGELLGRNKRSVGVNPVVKDVGIGWDPYYNYGINHFCGVVDEVKIYRRAKMAREIAADYRRGLSAGEKKAELAREAARKSVFFEDIHVVKIPKGKHGPRGMPGDIIELKDGKLLLCYTQVGIFGRISEDKGKTWGEPLALVPNPQPPSIKGAYGSPGFLRLKNGDILLSYIYTTYPTTPYYGHNYYRRSSDEGKTWSEQFVLTPHPGYVLVHNDRLMTLSSGRIVAPAEYKAHFPSTRDHSGYVGMTFYSDDQGYSWQASKNTVDMQPIEVQEPDAVELKDGRVMMFARTYSGFPVRAYSEDGCETWSKGEKIVELKMPCAGLPTVRRIPSTGDLLFIWISEKSIDEENPEIWRRCALTAAVSPDEGRTFRHRRHIARDPEDDYGYQSVTFVDDMAIISYHACDGLHVARIGIGWFYDRE